MGLSNILNIEIEARRFRSILYVSTFILSVVSPTLGHAQISLGAALGDMLGKVLTQARNYRVLVNPASVMVDPNTKTVALRFSNPTKDTLEAQISVRLNAPAGFGSAQKAKSLEKQAGELIADEPSDSSEVTQGNLIRSSASLVGWITGLPDRIKLAPGETKVITAKLIVPADAESGEYAGWIITGVHPSKQLTVEGGSSMSWKIGDGTALNESGARVVYIVK